MRNEKGLVLVIALLILAIAVILASAGAYYLLKSTGRYPDKTEEVRPLEVPISDSDKTTDIEKELESTDVGELDADFEDLNEEASSL